MIGESKKGYALHGHVAASKCENWQGGTTPATVAPQANPFAGRERSRTVPDPKASKFKIGGALMDFNSRSRTRERMGKVGESRRTALLRPIATAAPMAMIVLAVLRIPGDVPYVSWFRNIFTGNVPVEILRHLPPTLELIAVSFVVASAVGFGCALLYAGALKPVVSGLSVALRCIPFFRLALQLVSAGYYGRLPAAGIAGTAGFDIADRQSHLILPGGALTLFQLPPIVEYLSRRLGAALTTEVARRRLLAPEPPHAPRGTALAGSRL